MSKGLKEKGEPPPTPPKEGSCLMSKGLKEKGEPPSAPPKEGSCLTG